MKIFEKLFNPFKKEPETPAYISKVNAMREVDRWLRNLPDGAIIGTRQHDRAIVLEVEA